MCPLLHRIPYSRIPPSFWNLESAILWLRPQRRVMFFGGTDEEARKISGLVFPHPALIFKLLGKDLFVRAVATTSRPGPETHLTESRLIQ